MTAIDQTPALALDLLGDADNWPPRRLPPSHSIAIMTEEGSWPEFPGYDPTIATTSRVMWRSPQAAPAARAVARTRTQSARRIACVVVVVVVVNPAEWESSCASCIT